MGGWVTRIYPFGFIYKAGKFMLKNLLHKAGGPQTYSGPTCTRVQRLKAAKTLITQFGNQSRVLQGRHTCNTAGKYEGELEGLKRSKGGAQCQCLAESGEKLNLDVCLASVSRSRRPPLPSTKPPSSPLFGMRAHCTFLDISYNMEN